MRFGPISELWGLCRWLTGRWYSTGTTVALARSPSAAGSAWSASSISDHSAEESCSGGLTGSPSNLNPASGATFEQNYLPEAKAAAYSASSGKFAAVSPSSRSPRSHSKLLLLSNLLIRSSFLYKAMVFWVYCLWSRWLSQSDGMCIAASDSKSSISMSPIRASPWSGHESTSEILIWYELMSFGTVSTPSAKLESSSLSDTIWSSSDPFSSGSECEDSFWNPTDLDYGLVRLLLSNLRSIICSSGWSSRESSFIADYSSITVRRRTSLAIECARVYFLIYSLSLVIESTTPSLKRANARSILSPDVKKYENFFSIFESTKNCFCGKSVAAESICE